MSYKVEYTQYFIRELKRLAKRHRSLKKDVDELVTELEENPFLGTDLGNGLRKIRMAITSKGRDKSGGARVITYYTKKTAKGVEIHLVILYDKSEIDSIPEPILRSMVKELGIE